MKYFFSQYYALLVAAALIVAGILFLGTPLSFTPQTLVSIPEGTSFSQIETILLDAHVISSRTLFHLNTTLVGGTNHIQAGEYLFEKPQGTFMVAWRLIRGIHDIIPVRIVIPEGSTSMQIGTVLSKKLPHISPIVFANTASPYEGYLFPDTYFFLPTATSGEVIARLQMTFDDKTKTLKAAATSSPSWAEIVTMASILEEEARTPEDRRIVAGILWKRIARGMALQVDAPFMYLLGKTSGELTRDDLAIDSPYNTYTQRGLPPTPISNPGVDTIEAAEIPTQTPYWFYLSDSEGKMHYAETFEQHIENKRLYIK